MKKASYRRLIALLLLALVAGTARAGALSVGGTGSAAPIVRLLFEEFLKQAPDARLNQIAPPLGSGSAVKALAAGRIDLAVIGRVLKPAEAAQVGQQFALATTAFVLASSDAPHSGGFTVDQLARIYEGQLLTWPDGSPIRLILRARFESDTQVLREMSPAMAKAVDAASLRPGMVTADNDLDTLRLLARTPGSLGPTTVGLLTTSNTRLVILPINGVAPSLANLMNGSYPWRKTLTVVLPQQPGELAERFATFLRSAAASRLLQAYDYLPYGQ